MLAILANLLNAIGHALLLLGQFLAILFLGLLAALLYALPWLLRMACVLGWLIGGYMAIEAIQNLYGFHSPIGAVLALQFAVIFLMVAWAGSLLLVNPKHIWGGLALGGLLPAWITWKASPGCLRIGLMQTCSSASCPRPCFRWRCSISPSVCAICAPTNNFIFQSQILPGCQNYEDTMSETNPTNSMIDTLLGRDVTTDHGGLTLGDLIVLILDVVLLIYTGWRSYDFLTTSVPEGHKLLALVGLWGLDIGAVAWSLVWIFGSSTKYQDWVAMFFFVFDLMGVILTSLADSLMYGMADGILTKMIGGIAVVAVPLIVVANVVAGFIYHLTSPETKFRRETRRAENEYRAKMTQISRLERDLQYAESYVLARQEVLDKSMALAQIKMVQDGLEREMRLALRDQTGIHGLTPPMNGDDGKERLLNLRNRIETLRSQAKTIGAEKDEPEKVTANNGHHPAEQPTNFQ